MQNTPRQKRHHNQNFKTTFSVVERRIECPHEFQFYMDYGHTPAGPWMKIGLNETEFGFGYLPIEAEAPKLKIATPTAV